LSGFAVTRRHFLVWTGGALASARFFPALAADVTPQPYFASVKRALEALEKLGAPIAPADAQQIAALASQNDSAAVSAAEKILERYTIANLSIGSESVAHVTQGGAPRTLIEQGWRIFLIRVANAVKNTNTLEVVTYGGANVWVDGATPGEMGPGASLHFNLAARAFLLDTINKAPLIESMWLTAKPGTVEALSGIPIEYRPIELFSRDRGRRKAQLTFNLSSKNTDAAGLVQGHDWFEFTCLPTSDVGLTILDVDGRSCVASLTVKDKFDRIYPPEAMRLAPDMAFQPQIYRADGESVRLPDGEYTIESRRGPEYVPGIQTVDIDDSHRRILVKLERWIDPSKWGWYSGDTHIHAGGCAHYQIPTEGVSPETMIRQVRGEGLSIGDVLTWGPSWYYQKQFFTGHAESPQAGLEHPQLQVANHVTLQPRPTAEDSESALRYDVEVSGFPSSHAGHLVLLRLKEQDYPGTKLIEDWPSWNLPILKWAKAQSAVTGYAHCGIGMVVDSTDLPNYEIPPMDGVGTQEAIIDVTHGVVDFLSGCDTYPAAELNAWYHILNSGFRMAMIGETDYPCITGDRPGVGRSYVRLAHRPTDDAGYDAWIQGLKEGRLYCGDGRSHFLDFKVNGRRTGEGDLTLSSSGTVHIEALVAARLEPEITPEATPKRILPGLGWHLEWARIGKTRDVPVELIVNGAAVDKTTLLADGTPRSIKFKASIARSSWVALRIMPSAHTHPVFVMVGDKPIRASNRSAQWCRACVDKVWEVKSPFMRESERAAAAEAFEHARKTYDKIISECECLADEGYATGVRDPWSA